MSQTSGEWKGWTEDEERRVRIGVGALVKFPPADGHAWQWTNDNMLGALATIDALRQQLAAAQARPADAPGGEWNAAMEAALDALVWCGGSADFAPGGQARLGWERVVMPAMAAIRALKRPDAQGGDAQSADAPESRTADAPITSGPRDASDAAPASSVSGVGAPTDQAGVRVAKWMETQEFYDLCQAYRHAPAIPQDQAVAAYRALKDAIAAALTQPPRPPEDAREDRA